LALIYLRPPLCTSMEFTPSTRDQVKFRSEIRSPQGPQG